MRLVYGLSIRIFSLGILVAARFNAKARLWVDGRKNWRSALQQKAIHKGEYIWFHCASVGEFEQGRPLIESIKEKQPEAKIALSFFSPSGFELRKDYPLADLVCYLPLDTGSNARDFMEILQPKAAIFVKYEVWPEFYRSIKQSGIPFILISAIFRKEQRFFKFWGGLFRDSLKTLDRIFVQDQNSVALLYSIGVDQVTIAGDTRFDRVIKISEEAQPIPLIESFIGSRKTLIAGSSWPKEERMVAELVKRLDRSWCFIIAPHEVDGAHIEQIEKLIGEEAQRYSRATLGEIPKARILILDNLGMLARVYRYADFAIIGGGFGKGLHNTLEAAVYGAPLAFGPNHQKFKEARELVSNGAAITRSTEDELTSAVKKLLSDPPALTLMREQSAGYVQSGAGATRGILSYLEEQGVG